MVDKFDAVPRPPGDLMAIGKLNRKTQPMPKGYNEWLADNMGELKQLKVCMSAICRHGDQAQAWPVVTVYFVCVALLFGA